jgi:hypothetical protein
VCGLNHRCSTLHDSQHEVAQHAATAMSLLLTDAVPAQVHHLQKRAMQLTKPCASCGAYRPTASCHSACSPPGQHTRNYTALRLAHSAVAAPATAQSPSGATWQLQDPYLQPLAMQLALWWAAGLQAATAVGMQEIRR